MALSIFDDPRRDLVSTEVATADLQLGDVVRLFEGGYSDATVKQIKNGEVTMYRPYVITQDFSYTGGVICSIGLEEFTVPQSQWRTYKLVRNGGPLR